MNERTTHQSRSKVGNPQSTLIRGHLTHLIRFPPQNNSVLFFRSIVKSQVTLSDVRSGMEENPAYTGPAILVTSGPRQRIATLEPAVRQVSKILSLAVVASSSTSIGEAERGTTTLPVKSHQSGCRRMGVSEKARKKRTGAPPPTWWCSVLVLRRSDTAATTAPTQQCRRAQLPVFTQRLHSKWG